MFFGVSSEPKHRLGEQFFAKAIFVQTAQSIKNFWWYTVQKLLRKLQIPRIPLNFNFLFVVKSLRNEADEWLPPKN